MSTDIRPETGLRNASEKAGSIAAKYADAGDAQRDLTVEVVDALREAGFARHFVSSRWDGGDGTFGEFVQGVFNVAEGCASAAWCAALLAASARFASYLPEAGHRELWGSSPDTLIADGLIPAGKAQPVAGGHRLSGTWPYITNVSFADWALLCASVGDGPQPELRFFALPRGSYRAIENWDNAGMRATGSHSLVVEDVFVPEHLSYNRQDMVEGRNRWSSDPNHNIPYQATGALMLVTPGVGAALGAVKAAVQALKGKKLQEASQIELTRAVARIDAARLLVEQSAATVDRRSLTPALIARNQRNGVFANEEVAEGVNGLIRAAGTRGLSESYRLERFWRDTISATSHVGLRYDNTRIAATYSALLIDS
ncbi:MAG TPA: acyl-CoA dehydrogenase family protein [Actinocrinis sp.]|nr:acyl-CoA dehydrogenase family protein [Actinocrinis sp.]